MTRRIMGQSEHGGHRHEELEAGPFALFGVEVGAVWITFGRELRLTVLLRDDSEEARRTFSRWGARRKVRVETIGPSVSSQ